MSFGVGYEALEFLLQLLNPSLNFSLSFLCSLGHETLRVSSEVVPEVDPILCEVFVESFHFSLELRSSLLILVEVPVFG